MSFLRNTDVKKHFGAAVRRFTPPVAPAVQVEKVDASVDSLIPATDSASPLEVVQAIPKVEPI